jgi:hypothetical protein
MATRTAADASELEAVCDALTGQTTRQQHTRRRWQACGMWWAVITGVVAVVYTQTGGFGAWTAAALIAYAAGPYWATRQADEPVDSDLDHLELQAWVNTLWNDPDSRVALLDQLGGWANQWPANEHLDKAGMTTKEHWLAHVLDRYAGKTGTAREDILDVLGRDSVAQHAYLVADRARHSIRTETRTTVGDNTINDARDAVTATHRLRARGVEGATDVFTTLADGWEGTVDELCDLACELAGHQAGRPSQASTTTAS